MLMVIMKMIIIIDIMINVTSRPPTLPAWGASCSSGSQAAFV